MRKALLALIACLVAVIAYASPGSPYLSHGWRPSGGTHTPPTVINNFTAVSPGPVTVSGISAGDVLFIVGVSRVGAAATSLSCTPACTTISMATDSSNNGILGTGYIIAAGGETSVAVTDNLSDQYGIWVFQVRGVDNVTVQDFTASNQAFAAGVSLTSGSLTPGHNNALIFAATSVDSSVNGVCSSAAATSTATGTTNAWTTNFFTDSSAGRCTNMGVGYASQTTAGAITVTGSQTNGDVSPRISMAVVGFKSATP